MSVIRVIRVIRDIWLCQDCTQVAVNGDYSGLDYYDQAEAEIRKKEIDAGLKHLPGLVPDDGDEQAECRACGWIGDQDSPERLTILDEDGEEVETETCPDCGEEDSIRHRDSGNDEFSWADCDCCGSGLGGSRTRFAQLITETEGTT